MRSWLADPDASGAASGADLIATAVPALGEAGFGAALLGALGAALPVGSLSVYRTGARPAIFLTASTDVHDTTRDCWRAYLSGPIRHDRTLRSALPQAPSRPLQRPHLCHITAGEVPSEHRAKVYEAHGVAERISVVEEDAEGDVFAVNFYRHARQRPLNDGQIADFSQMGGLLMALTRKHVALTLASASGTRMQDAQIDRLRELQPALTVREVEVCSRLLQGMSQDGIAADLNIGVPTVKTYRNRAFARLGIHFRSELFALASGAMPMRRN
ncbi:helix-turn-helix transcriptional regulator [Variovorax ginsengisoli]|uniref:DNA-binding CsgD family transcriptional regulator n=1 Tax=Variovorax ginsengisoli TaxID=363844 RepID=A0ABT9S5K2_9BURK|nr:helix-turn-helix transcriptional regulator [Variovorax ginsengisoli]MDP9899164.1 DNA-binding CsgD family transcriptional regulator [Variovorax ginsengisoli]